MLNLLINFCKGFGEDVDVSPFSTETNIEVWFKDFVGFDENWDEVMRDFDNPNVINEVKAFVKSNNINNVEYHFTSEDI